MPPLEDASISYLFASRIDVETTQDHTPKRHKQRRMYILWNSWTGGFPKFTCSTYRKCNYSIVGFFSPFLQRDLKHWTHRIEYTGMLDVELFEYLFIFSAQWGLKHKPGYKGHQRGLSNNKNNHEYKILINFKSNVILYYFLQLCATNNLKI